MKHILTILTLFATIHLYAQEVVFNEGVNREVDTTTKLFYSKKPGSLVRLGLVVATDTTWLLYNGSNLHIISDTVFVNETPIGSSLWEEGSGTASIFQKGISPGLLSGQNYMVVIGRLGLTRFLDGTANNPSHIVGYKAADSTTLPIYFQNGILDGDTLKSKISDGANEGQLAYWDTATSKWAYAELGKLRWKVDSTMLFAKNIQSDSIAIGTDEKEYELTVSGTISLFDETNSIYIGKTAGQNVVAGQNEYNIGIGGGALNGITTGERNTALGYSAISGDDIGEDNTGIGYQALTSQISSSAIFRYNTAVGSMALSNSTGRQNTALGYKALYANVSGSYNIGVGGFTLIDLTSGNYNIAIGDQSSQNITTGRNNLAIGANTLGDCQTGIYNISIGDYSLSDYLGSSNIAIGYQALLNVENSLARSNIAIGQAAGAYSLNDNGETPGNLNDSSYYCILIGHGTEVLNSTDTNSIIIGNDAIPKGSNTVVLGNDDIDSTFLKGLVQTESIHISSTLNLSPQPSAPSNPTNGLMYLSSTDNKVHIYINSSWYSLDITAD